MHSVGEIFKRMQRPGLIAFVITALSLMNLSFGLIASTAQVTQPVKIVIHGMEVASDVPAIMMSSRVFVPDQFLAEILGYPVKWDAKKRGVIVGVPESGIDLVRTMPAYTGTALKRPVKFEAENYAYGYELTPKNDVRWNLKGIFDTVTFSFGIPDGKKMSSASMAVVADGKTIAEEIIAKSDGLKELSYNVADVKILTVKYHKEQGGVMVNPWAFQSEEDAHAPESEDTQPTASGKSASNITPSSKTAQGLDDESTEENTDQTQPSEQEQTTKRPLSIFVDGEETASDQPIIIKGKRIYVPLRFVVEALGYPIAWENSSKTVYIGSRHTGTDLVDKKPSKSGVKIKQPVRLGSVNYPKGYTLGASALHTITWNLDGRYNYLTFSFGVPDGFKGKSAGFIVTADGRKKLAEVLTKDDGLKEFGLSVKKVETLTITSYKGAGGVIINPRAQ